MLYTKELKLSVIGLNVITINVLIMIFISAHVTNFACYEANLG